MIDGPQRPQCGQCAPEPTFGVEGTGHAFATEMLPKGSDGGSLAKRSSVHGIP